MRPGLRHGKPPFEGFVRGGGRGGGGVGGIERDAMDKARRSMLRAAPTVIDEVLPGSRVYFWSPAPLRGRRRQDPERWRGPASVIARGGPGSIRLVVGAQSFSVANEQMRCATSWRTAAREVISADLSLTAAQRNDRSYRDVSGETAKPAIHKTKGAQRSFLKKERRVRCPHWPWASSSGPLGVLPSRSPF